MIGGTQGQRKHSAAAPGNALVGQVCRHLAAITWLFQHDLNTPAFRIGKATVVNARAAHDLGRFTLSAHVRNLFDNFYLTSQFSPTFATAGDPREIGLGLEMRS